LAAPLLLFILGITAPFSLIGVAQVVIFENHTFKTQPHLYELKLLTTYYFFLEGDNTITICRPSILGNCSTCPNGSKSAFNRSNIRTPISW
jgi:hypothetical protein